MVIRDGCAGLRAVRQTHNVGARPCGCTGAVRGTPDAPTRQTSPATPGTCASRRHRNPSRASRRRGALGVPHPAPGQPQGRAPTGAWSSGMGAEAKRTMVISDGCARQSHHVAKPRVVRQTRNVGARPCGCPGAGPGTPDASIRRTSRATPGSSATPRRNPSRPSRRLGALGVPHPAPGQPQGRAPTGARSSGMGAEAKRTMVIRDGCAHQSHHGAGLRAVRQAHDGIYPVRRMAPFVLRTFPRERGKS